MRVTSAFWVAAFLRRHMAGGGFAAVERRGAEEAGAIFILVDRLDGRFDLYGPAPQTAFDDAHPDDRRFQRLAEGEMRETIVSRLARESRFDPDLWTVTVENRDGTVELDLV